MQLSARNQLSGTIAAVIYGNVMAEVVIEIDGGQHVVAMISSQSAKSLNLAPGMKAAAVIKSTDVMVGVE